MVAILEFQMANRSTVIRNTNWTSPEKFMLVSWFARFLSNITFTSYITRPDTEVNLARYIERLGQADQLHRRNNMAKWNLINDNGWAVYLFTEQPIWRGWVGHNREVWQWLQLEIGGRGVGVGTKDGGEL